MMFVLFLGFVCFSFFLYSFIYLFLPSVVFFYGVWSVSLIIAT